MPDFPEIPENLAGLSDEQLQALADSIAQAAQPFAEMNPDEHTDETLGQINQLSEMAAPVATEIESRRSRQAALNTATRLTGMAAAPTEPADTDQDSPESGPDNDAQPVAQTDTEGSDATVAADTGPGTGTSAPSVAQVARQRTGRRTEVQPTSPTLRASMVAAADVPGFPTGQELDTFADASKAVEARLNGYTSGKRVSRGRSQNARLTEVDDVDLRGNFRNARQHQMRKYTRHGAVNLRREYPEDLRMSSEDGMKSLRTLQYASSEYRLTGGSLAKAVQHEMDRDPNLVSAAGWCAISENIYDLCEQESMDGILATPEVVADRGGFNIPENGGIDFATIFTTIGDAGDTHLTEDEVIADTVKVCTEVPCPPFVEARLGVDYVCLTASFLQRRGYPEVVQRFSRGAMVAMAHKINAGKIAAIATGSGAAIPVDGCVAGDDALGTLLSAVDLAREDAITRARMPFNTTMEVVLPHWAMVQLRAAAAHRRGVNMLDVSDAELTSYFTRRRVVPRWVYDWQDQFTGRADGPGGATPLSALPTSVNFLIYPAGTWVAAVADVVNLDTVYDSTLISTNQYTALFVEDGWAMMQMCPISRQYQVELDPCGCLCADASAVIESP